MTRWQLFRYYLAFPVWALLLLGLLVVAHWYVVGGVWGLARNVAVVAVIVAACCVPQLAAERRARRVQQAPRPPARAGRR